MFTGQWRNNVKENSGRKPALLISDYWQNLGTRNYSSGPWSLQEVSLYLIRNLNLFDQELNCKFCFDLGGPCCLFFLGAKKEF